MNFHRSHGKYVTVTAAQPLGRFGALDISETGEVKGFREKPKGDDSWINGGFFVMEPEVFNYLKEDDTNLELDPLRKISEDNQFMAYKHEGFWQPMDMMRDKVLLEELWKTGNAPWKVWE
jgi:glucose-1-phosphate cytidylyltransferase